MSDGLNKVMLLGNLGADPELRFTQAGQAVLNLRLATTESYLDKNKERKERTDWHNVTVWGNRAEALAKFLRKGSSLFVEGRLQTSSYEKDGTKRYKTEIVANNIILTGGKRKGSAEPDESKPDDDSTPSRYGTSGHGASAKHTGTPEPADVPEDDIPF